MSEQSSFEIRRATMSDLDSLVTFNQGIARETEGRELPTDVLTEGVRRVLNDSGLGFYLVAVQDEKVAGCLMVTFEWSDWRNAMFWWVQSVYVCDEYRRQGVYRRLYENVRELAAEENVCGFRLYVEKENAVAKRTYESLGMKQSMYDMFEEKR